MPVFMYRKGEAKLFASLSDVPANEGWQDTPPTDMVVNPDGEITFGAAAEPTPAVIEPRVPESSEDLKGLLQASIDAEHAAETEDEAEPDVEPETLADGEPVNYLQPPKKRGRPRKVTDEPNS